MASQTGRKPAPLRRLVILAGPLAGVFLTLTYALVGDRTVWGEWLTIWPSIGWAALLLVRASILWLQREKRAAVATVLGAALLVGSTTEWPPLLRTWTTVSAPSTPLAASANVRERRTLRVVSWNVSEGGPLATLETLRPDICFLQEVGALQAAIVRSPAWSGVQCLEGLDPALLSRFPLRRLPSEKIGPWVDPLLALAELPDRRRLLLVSVRLALPGIVTAFADPAEWRGIGRAHAQRLGQFARLAELIERRRREHSVCGVILAGDFNTPGGMPSLAPLTAGLRDVWLEAGRGWGATMTAEWPLSRIDQCWVSREIGAHEAHVERHPESDHRLLVVDLELRFAPPPIPLPASEASAALGEGGVAERPPPIGE